jgi:hypothetical protein
MAPTSLHGWLQPGAAEHFKIKQQLHRRVTSNIGQSLACPVRIPGPCKAVIVDVRVAQWHLVRKCPEMLCIQLLQ